jgi:hypothetical protein
LVTTPNWSAARSGVLGDPGATDASSQINQLLGTHGITAVYQGNSILTPIGSGGTAWQYHLDAYDIAQPFTMSGTTIGRVAVPLLPVGNGADLIVSLYTNSAGVPGTLANQVRIPANWISQLAAVSGITGPSSTAPTPQYTGNPLALAQFNGFHMGVVTTVTWTYPQVAPGFGIISGADAIYPGYAVSVGGVNGSTFYNNIFSIAYDSAGNLAQAIPQPGLPTNNNGGCGTTFVTDSSGNVSLIVAGGSTSPGVHVNTVYVAGFNPTTGVISAWTNQTNLPQALYNPNAAAWNGYVYIVGGVNNAGTPDLNTVYYAQIQNSQITSWSTATPLPIPLDSMWTAAINGFLFIFGGATTGGAIQTTCWFASIHSDGSLGAWQIGPSLPTGSVDFQATTPTFDSYGIIACANSQMYVLGVGPNGPSASWQVSNIANGGVILAEATVSPGSWIHYGLYNNFYTATPIALTPRISVPLPTSGLSNGTTYHVVLSQPGGDAADYLRTHDDFDVFSGNPTLLTRARGSSSWVAGTTGHAVPIQVYDGSATGQVYHLWEDAGARISTIVNATTPDNRLLGLLEAVAQPGPILNQWPVFTNGLGPWHATGATITQSNAFTQGELPFSMLITPSGSATLSYAESDLVPVQQGHSYVATTVCYSPPGYANITVSVNWFDVNKNYLSTTSGSVNTIAAGTWTQFQTTVTNNVANAVYADIVPVEGATPPNTAVFYVSTATLQDTLGPQLSTVTRVTYPGTWPGSGAWPPTGVVELA